MSFFNSADNDNKVLFIEIVTLIIASNKYSNLSNNDRYQLILFLIR